jgi:hypothetical protein
MLPAAERLPEARQWVADEEYFLIHAPRQSGKTTTLTALANELTAEGRHVALRFSCERGEAGPDDIAAAERRILRAIRNAAVGRSFPADWMPPDPWPESDTGSRIADSLQAWALKSPLPLVLFFDEIDSLAGNSLNSVLRQIRDGYSWRPHAFPSSVALCGMRHLRDYKLASGSAAPARSGRAARSTTRSRTGWLISPSLKSLPCTTSTPSAPDRSSPPARSTWPTTPPRASPGW